MTKPAPPALPAHLEDEAQAMAERLEAAGWPPTQAADLARAILFDRHGLASQEPGEPWRCRACKGREFWRNSAGQSVCSAPDAIHKFIEGKKHARISSAPDHWWSAVRFPPQAR